MMTVRAERRYRELDILKGILIILVVIGHSCEGIVHEIIFLFHMPLFFMISGVLLNEKKLGNWEYVKNKIFSLMIPYFFYILLDTFLLSQNFTIKGIIKILWGGRAIGGVYWYITCYLFALVLISLLKRKFSSKTILILGVIGGGYSSDRISHSRDCRTAQVSWNTLEFGYCPVGFSVFDYRILF